LEVNKFINAQANHSIIAREVAAEGTVLLKNEGLLPISRDGLPDARLKSRRSNIYRAIGKRHEGKFKVGIFGDDAGPGNGPNFCKDRSCNQGTLGSGWGSGAVEFPYLVAPVTALRAQFDKSKVELHEYLSDAPPRDQAVINDLELCLVFVNADSGEGFSKWAHVSGDRPDLHLQKDGDNLILRVASECGSGTGDVIVVIHSVGPVLMEKWIDLPNIKAVLFANLPGEESGNALADILFGDTNPSGHLPFTIGKSLDDYGPGAKVLYTPNGVIPQQDFKEGLYIDYRHFDKHSITPRFEFGFGLSYTSFSFSNLVVSPQKTKSPFPAPRPSPAVEPPSYPTSIPDASEALFPKDFRPLQKYIYPYLNSTDEIVAGRYSYPDGYDTPAPLSPAGGDEGGNPDLWNVYVEVSVEVSNTGPVAGAVVPQLYLSYPEMKDVDFPVRVLRGFEKIFLNPGQKEKVIFGLTRRDLSYWDVEAQNWRMVVEGGYKLVVGEGSRDENVSGTW
jgi:beta-glucosidase